MKFEIEYRLNNRARVVVYHENGDFDYATPILNKKLAIQITELLNEAARKELLLIEGLRKGHSTLSKKIQIVKDKLTKSWEVNRKRKMQNTMDYEFKQILKEKHPIIYRKIVKKIK